MAVESERIHVEKVTPDLPHFCPYSDDTGESMLHLQARIRLKSEDDVE